MAKARDVEDLHTALPLSVAAARTIRVRTGELVLGERPAFTSLSQQPAPATGESES
ncbi:MAG: hypothetical protein ACXVFN_10895 [Solirubrobacteraceae bacterium]